MPKSVAIFEKLAYLALILGTVSVAINYPVTMRLRGATTSSIVTIQTLSMLFQILFIWLIARRRKNWARWIWIVVMIAGSAFALLVQIFRSLPQNGIAGWTAYLAVYLVSLASGVYLLKTDSRGWFRLPSEQAPARDPSDMRLQS